MSEPSLEEVPKDYAEELNFITRGSIRFDCRNHPKELPVVAGRRGEDNQFYRVTYSIVNLDNKPFWYIDSIEKLK